MQWIVAIFALFFIVPDAYISLVLMRSAVWWAHLLLWLPTIVAVAMMAAFRFQLLPFSKMDIFMALLFCIALPQVFFLVFSVVGKLLSLFWQPALTIGNSLGIGIGAVVSAAMLFGLTCGWKQLNIRHIDLSFDNLPQAFEGYRIAQLSDLHVGSYGTNPAFLQQVVQRVNNEQADLIVFTGDIINTQSDEVTPFESTLTGLHAQDGVMSVLGNHDYCLYGFGKRSDDPREGAIEVVQAERRMGWDLLLNEHRFIRRGNDSIAVIGVENTGKPPFPKIGDLHGAMQGVPEDLFTILLSHDPSHWRMQVLPETHIPLMLAGHTHAAQLKIGSWSPSAWLYDEWSGLYEEKTKSQKNKTTQQLYVSEGTGGSIPFRLGATPEVIIFTLHTNKSNK